MSTLFNHDVYPNVRVDTSSLPIQSLYEITVETEHNPVKVANAAMGSTTDMDLLWSANHIRNPYKELVAGRIIKVPLLSQLTDKMAESTKVERTLKLKHVQKTADNKLIY